MSSVSSQKQPDSPNAPDDKDPLSLIELTKNNASLFSVSLNDLKTKRGWLMEEVQRLNKEIDEKEKLVVVYVRKAEI
ncbi:hypothetical protein Tco_0480502 [Tanacetum coccineum]